MGRRALLVGAFLFLASLARAAGPESVSFETSDGFTLKADLWRAADPKAPVAILLHQFNRDRHSFPALVPALQQQGFTVLALDQRGQGDSTRQKTPGGERTVRIQELPRNRVGPLVKAGPADVAAALAFLASQGAATDRVALVGASYGCTVSLLTTDSEKSVRAVALLSPGADYFGVDALAPARTFHGALFAIAAEDDPVKSSPASAGALVQAHDGPERLLIHPSGGHGVALLDTHPELAAEISRFLAHAVSAP
jgi:pimeloyl-ACP methyl ester carboxylesterase